MILLLLVKLIVTIDIRKSYVISHKTGNFMGNISGNLYLDKTKTQKEDHKVRFQKKRGKYSISINNKTICLKGNTLSFCNNPTFFTIDLRKGNLYRIKFPRRKCFGLGRNEKRFGRNLRKIIIRKCRIIRRKNRVWKLLPYTVKENKPQRVKKSSTPKKQKVSRKRPSRKPKPKITPQKSKKPKPKITPQKSKRQNPSKPEKKVSESSSESSQKGEDSSDSSKSDEKEAETPINTVKNVQNLSPVTREKVNIGFINVVMDPERSVYNGLTSMPADNNKFNDKNHLTFSEMFGKGIQTECTLNPEKDNDNMPLEVLNRF